MKNEKYTRCEEGRPPQHKRKNASAQPRGAFRSADQPIRAHASANHLRFHTMAATPLRQLLLDNHLKLMHLN